MQIVEFYARSPYEIGDVIRDMRAGQKRQITDIVCVRYSRNGRVEFLYELDNNSQYVRLADPMKETIIIK